MNDNHIMEHIIDHCTHMKEDEKKQTKEIRKLYIELTECCEKYDLNVVLNSLDLLREFYLKKLGQP